MTAPTADPKERINNYVAISVAILAAFMAVTKVKDDNICQAMVKEKSEEVNTWAYYQSKSVKQNLAELGRTELSLQALNAATEVRPKIEEQVSRYTEEIARYEAEKAQIKANAERHAHNYDVLNFMDDQFDLSDATLSISLAMLAVTALTSKRWLLYVSWGVGGFGALMGVSGLMGLSVHPDWIIKWLS